MIKPVNFKLPIKTPNISFRANQKLGIVSADSVELSDESKLEIAKQRARQSIIEHMKTDNKEYGFVLSSNGGVLDEIQGTENECIINEKNGYSFIHGHPKKAPLSIKDVISFLGSNLNSVEAISPDGQYSRMTKAGSADNIDLQTLYEELSLSVCTKFLDFAGIDYKETEDDLVELFKKYMQNSGISMDKMSKEETLKQMSAFGLYKNNDVKKAYKDLCMCLYMQTYDSKYSNPDKTQSAILQNKQLIEELTYTPDGIRICNELWTELANKYNLKYETNML